VLLVRENMYFEEDFEDKKESEKMTSKLMMLWQYTLSELRGYCEDSSVDSGADS
jgi:hypothetical protein